MRKLNLILMALLIALPQMSWAFEELVLNIADDHKVYFKYQEASPGKPTVILLNGLIYAIENWDEYFAELSADGTGVLQIAYSTQPESLVQLGVETPFYAKMTFHPLYGFIQKGLSTQTQVDEVMAVVDHLEIDRFSLVSLSYGSIVASELATQYAQRIDHLILMAPAVVTSGRYNPYGASRHAYYEKLSTFNIYADYLYDTEIGLTLSALVTANKYQFEGVFFEDFYSGVYQMARSSKWFDLKNYASAELPPTSLFIASEEDKPLYKDQKLFWEMMKQNKSRQSMVLFEGSYHAIPGVAPEAAATWTLKILQGDDLGATSVVKVGTGNAPGTTAQSLLDYSELSEEAWQEKK